MEKAKLIMVGGFLGAGKTSILYKAGEILTKCGEKVGLITNDQATNLVDTVFLSGHEMAVTEVSGSCFCCNFPGFIKAVEEIAEATDNGIIIAEPVGSCTDLSATIMQPVKDKYNSWVVPSPMTVVADPERLRGLLDKVPSKAAYITEKQFDEADIILINKIDVLDDKYAEELIARTKERWPKAKVMSVSAKEGTGVEAWLEEVLSGGSAGSNLATVDYDVYADGEAAYGWLNATYSFEKTDTDLGKDAGELLEILDSEFSKAGVVIGHVKFLLRGDDRQWLGNLTGMADHKTLRETAGAADGQAKYTLTVNARAEIGPKALQDITIDAIDKSMSDCVFTATDIRTLIPGRPNPTYHYDKVI